MVSHSPSETAEADLVAHRLKEGHDQGDRLIKLCVSGIRTSARGRYCASSVCSPADISANFRLLRHFEGIIDLRA